MNKTRQQGLLCCVTQKNLSCHHRALLSLWTMRALFWTNVVVIFLVAGLITVNAGEAKQTLRVGQAQVVSGQITINPGNGLSEDPSFFPVGVWYQDPELAAEFAQIGVNTYIGLWDGNDSNSSQMLREAGIIAVAPQDQYGLASYNQGTIRAWHNTDDEPDIGPLDESGVRIHPIFPIPPLTVLSDYQRMKMRASLPVYVNFGPGVAFSSRESGAERYLPYMAAADIVSFNIYPLNPGVYGMEQPLPFSMMAEGMDNLRTWAGAKPAYAFIETTSIHNDSAWPTYEQLRSQIWLALINGANGIQYFCHIMQPKLIEAGCLQREDTKAAMTAVNSEIRSLAPILNAGNVLAGVQVKTPRASRFHVDTLVKRWGATTYVFAESWETAGSGRAVFKLPGKRDGIVTVLNENRTLPIKKGRFADTFGSYQVHLYQVTRY